MSKKQQERKEKKRKERVKAKLLRRRMNMREQRKLEKELDKLRKSQEEKIVPIRKKSNDN